MYKKLSDFYINSISHDTFTCDINMFIHIFIVTDMYLLILYQVISYF